MAVMLPGEVSYLLNMLGFEWPEGNEDKVFEWAGDWSEFAGKIQRVVGEADGAARIALERNQGEAMTAFREAYQDLEGVQSVARDLALAGNITGACLVLVAGAIIALKIAFVVNLVSLAIQIASAVSAAAVTFGASLAWIPVAREICRRLITLAINLALEKLLGGGA